MNRRPQRPASSRPALGPRLAGVVLGAVVAAGAAACTGGQPTPSPTAPSPSSPAATRTDEGPPPAQASGGATGGDIPSIVQDVEPSVVTVFTPDGVGSGVVYREDGLILTNEHVIRGATEVEVGFADGQRAAGTVRATDRVSDLALVHTERTDLPAAQFETRLPRVGELAVVIGSPLGFENTVTAGIVSGLQRSIPGSASSSLSLVDLIQTDAPISPGNSGGAVVNAEGKVIGISEAYIPPQAGAVALGFAIPAATAVEVAEELLADGTADHAFLGLGPARITQQIASELGLPDTRGILVLSVADGGPAAGAGIRPGDVLLTVDGKDLTAPEDLLSALRPRNPGDTIDVGLRRDGAATQLKVTLAERPTGSANG